MTKEIQMKSNISPTEYWSKHMVETSRFKTQEEAIHHFRWRSEQYIDYLNYMPVSGQDGKIVLDYGCGPGHDTVGFSAYSNPEKIISMDISAPAIEIAKNNVGLFRDDVEFHLINENNNKIPLPDKSVDYIHCSGVLMCTTDLDTILSEFHRVLKDDGEMAIMVYNYQSIYLHLYTAYIQPVKNKKFVGLPLMEAFKRNTDGEECPISTCYKPEEFNQKVSQFGFKGKFLGAGVSLLEMQLARYRFEAIKHYELAQEHRDFLLNLTFDNRQVPYFEGHAAGIDACFRFKKQ